MSAPRGLPVSIRPAKSKTIHYLSITLAENPTVTWLFDVDFLTSSWQCIFNNGCKGVLEHDATELGYGCCSYGAHMVDEEEADRIRELAKQLPAELFQLKGVATNKDPVVKVGGSLRTRIVDGACVFLNRKGFRTGPGCALHFWALKRKMRPMRLKPTVCWQLPLKVEYLESDGHTYCIMRRWERRDWGEAGFGFHWWCTEAPEAHGATEPLYRRLRAEIEEICGFKTYKSLVEALETRTKTYGRET